MNRYRQIVESMKKEFANDLLSGKSTYIRAVVRQIDYEFRQYIKDVEVIDLKNFGDRVTKRLRVPSAAAAQIQRDLEDVQLRIADVWKGMFVTKTGAAIDDTAVTKMLPSYQIDFSSIDIGGVVEAEAKIAINRGLGYEDLRSRLMAKNLGFDEINTLANTATAMFDNAAHVENAMQAGVIYYLYDGVEHPEIRDFCKKHLNRVYTIAELQAMSNGQGLSVVTSLGGYNCTHFLTALVNYVRKAIGEIFNPSHFKQAA